MYIYSLPLNFAHTPTSPHPPRLSQSPELSSLLCTAASPSYLLCMWQCASISPNLRIHLPCLALPQVAGIEGQTQPLLSAFKPHPPTAWRLVAGITTSSTRVSAWGCQPAPWLQVLVLQKDTIHTGNVWTMLYSLPVKKKSKISFTDDSPMASRSVCTLLVL